MKKTIIPALLGGILLPGIIETRLYAQPSSIAGNALVVQVNNSTGAYNAPAYYLLLPANSGNGYESVGISGIPNSSGTYTYSGAGPNLQLSDSIFGPEDMSFGSLNMTGSFALTAGTNNAQSGNVWLANGLALTTIDNHSYYLNISAGGAPFVSQGSVIFSVLPNQTSYFVFPTSIGISASYGTYEYSLANASTGFFSLNDFASGYSDEYLAFTGSSGGIYMVTQPSGAFQVGTFSVANLMPSLFFMGQVDLSPKVEWLEFPDSVPFGYYDMMDFGFPLFYHFDLGFEYYFDANDSANGCYLYDFASKTFFYTTPAMFPYLYDFTLNAWLYYYPNNNSPGHYTTNPRYFYNFTTQQIITK